MSINFLHIVIYKFINAMLLFHLKRLLKFWIFYLKR